MRYYAISDSGDVSLVNNVHGESDEALLRRLFAQGTARAICITEERTVVRIYSLMYGKIFPVTSFKGLSKIVKLGDEI